MIKMHVFCFIFVLINVVLCFLLTLIFWSASTRDLGVVTLERDARSYTNEELYETAKKKFSNNEDSRLKVNEFKDQGTAQSLFVWLMGLVIMRKVYKLYLVYSLIALSLLTMVEFYSMSQVIFITGGLAVGFLILNLKKTKSTDIYKPG